MGFIKVEREVPSGVNNANNSGNINTRVNNSTNFNGYDSLSNLNGGSCGYNYDFASEHDAPGMGEGKLKNERGLLGAFFQTLVNILVSVLILCGLVYLGVRYLDTSISLFPVRDTYTAMQFNDGLKKCFLISFLVIVFMMFITMIIVNGAVKKVFRKKYLNKINIYIYDFYLVLVNIGVYVLEAFLMFQVVDDLHSDFKLWVETKKILESVNIETIMFFKYVIVVIIAIFMVLNSFSAIGIVHKKNKFVLNGEV